MGKQKAGAGDSWDISERHFRQQVLDLARMLGWHCYFSWTSLHSPKGYPDLTLCQSNGDGTASLCFLELKSETGKCTPEQREWLDILGKVPGVIAKCVYPSDWDEIVLLLKG